MDCITNAMNMSLSKLWELMMDREWHATVHESELDTSQGLNNIWALRRYGRSKGRRGLKCVRENQEPV